MSLRASRHGTRRVPFVLVPFLLAAALLLGAVSASAQAPSFIAFESGPVRPLALSEDGHLLFATNTPDSRLEIFLVGPQGRLRHLRSVPVGLEPVAVGVASPDEVWVVNHLSDSVSVVDVSAPSQARVVRTLLVGDEPRDIVFAGTPRRAFITTAHRGQQRAHPSLAGVPGAGDPQLTTPGVPRADVWVFDVADLDQGAPEPTVGGVPAKIVELFGDTPRALAVSPDGGTVYAGIFNSGNQTATVGEEIVCDGFDEHTKCDGDGEMSPNGLPGGKLPGGLHGPEENHYVDPDSGQVQNVAAPEVGLIVKYDEASGEWQDEKGRNWSNGVRFDLPDHDVFEIDADTLQETRRFDHVGTTLFNMAVNPATGALYVTNQDAKNLTRFEGPGGGGSTVQGNLAQARITVITPNGDVKPRHLNRHIDYDVLPAPAGTEQHSLATPLDMELSPDGSTLYVAAFGSSKLGVIPTADLEDDGLWDGAGAEFDPTQASAGYIPLGGGGPAGLALHEASGRLFVLTRFDNAVAVVDPAAGAEVASVPLSNPEPASVVEGRPMLYDAVATSSNGEASCASCHIFGDKDELAWDLGDPDAPVTVNPIPNEVAESFIDPANEFGFIDFGHHSSEVNGGAAYDEFHPMKGPMTTQTLKGLSNSGHMHWRGDRVSGFFDIAPTPEHLSFNNFIVAFEGLLGDDVPATDPQRQADMAAFTEFALQMTLPPNPVRALDNSLDAAQQAGEDFYFGPISDFIENCNGCHAIDPARGQFGTNGNMSFEAELQTIKIPQLRNLYTKVGMFGIPGGILATQGDLHQGPQVRGFGFIHDGSIDTLARFLSTTLFTFPDEQTRLDTEQFLLAIDTDLAPIVGQQVTDEGSGSAAIRDRIDLLRQRAGATFTSQILGGTVTECDLVVKGTKRGWLYDPGANLYEPDRAGEPFWTQAELDVEAAGGAGLTYTCVPPGSGVRAALDQDLDGVYDGDERADGTDPADAASFADACRDGLDNDGDGLVDLADPGCRNADWGTESPACDDGVDNDADGLVDLADDGCQSGWNLAEYRRQACGLGAELALLLPLLAAARRRISRR